VKAAIGPNTGGILIEPIQGEGGVKVATEEFLQALRALCDEHDLMLIFDEVQTGVARTGTFYAYEQFDVVPDILATAKGIGGGFPVGACLATEKAARGMVAGTHGSTYGGNPLAMAAANAVLDAVANDEFMAHVRDMGAKLTSRLEQFIGNYPDLFELVRGRGLMLGLKMKVEPRPLWRICATIINCSAFRRATKPCGFCRRWSLMKAISTNSWKSCRPLRPAISLKRWHDGSAFPEPF
jgi:acetylornithine/N-succinyldiaminopimelate aminotransferase